MCLDLKYITTWTLTLGDYVTIMYRICYKLASCVWTAPHPSGWWNVVRERYYAVNTAHAKVISDWETRSREHIGTESAFLFSLRRRVLRDCRVDFSELSEGVPVCEAIRECVCVRGRVPISRPRECDQRIAFLTRSVRAERRCCKPVWVRMHACPHSWRAAFGVYICCIIHSFLTSAVHQRLILPAFI